MKSIKTVKYISISGFILTVIFDLLKTGGEGVTVIVVLISSFLFIATSIKTMIFQEKWQYIIEGNRSTLHASSQQQLKII